MPDQWSRPTTATLASFTKREVGEYSILSNWGDKACTRTLPLTTDIETSAASAGLAGRKRAEKIVTKKPLPRNCLRSLPDNVNIAVPLLQS